MARPQPQIIFTNVDDDDHGFDVCSSDGIYAVYYQDQPIQVRTRANVTVRYPGWKYLRTCFSSSGPAFNLARRLNRRFDTTEFTVVKLAATRQITQKNR